MSACTLTPGGQGDIRAVLDFVSAHFVPQAPLSASLNLVQEPGSRLPYFERKLERCLSEEETVTVLAKHSQTGEMLGVCVVSEERTNTNLTTDHR